MTWQILAGNRNYFVCEGGLTIEEADIVGTVAESVLNGARDRFLHALSRCTFFGDLGYGVLSSVIDSFDDIANPRIEGSDRNPFNQHYWVAFDLVRGELRLPVVIDPIFGHIGLQGTADDFNREYYSNKRKVQPHKSFDDDGVRLNTRGI